MLRKLFLVLALLQLVPVWSPAYFPTTDGPSHLYNAFVLRELILRHDGPIAQLYAVDWHPYPNVLGHVVLAMLLGVFSAAVAEKILVSAIVLLFLGGAWMLAGAVDERGHVYAFLAFPLAFHVLLQFGFYNFAISAGLYFVALAVWWRRRDRPDWQTILLIALLTLLCYASHPTSTVLLIGSVGLLWLMTLRGRPLRAHAMHLIAFLPAAPLLTWFFLRQGMGKVGHRAPLAERLVNLSRIEIVQTFDGVQLALGRGLAIAIVALTIATIVIERRRREEDAFLVLFVVVVALFLVVPNVAAGGSFVAERLATFVPLLPLPWLTPRLDPRLRGALAIALAVVASANAWFLTKQERRVARTTAAFVRAERAIPPRRTVLVINGEPGLLWHAGGYAAIEHRQGDVDNYEADAGYFPVQRRPGTPSLDFVSIETDPQHLDVDSFAPLAEYVFVWRMYDTAPVLSNLDFDYELVSASADARIYRRRAEASQPAWEVLLPIAGTAHPIDGLQERWSVEQTVANRGSRPVWVRLSAFAVPPRAFELGPGEVRRIASRPEQPFIVARVPLASARDVAFDTAVERVGYDGRLLARAPVPSIPLASFRRRTIDVPAVPLVGRVRLHVWIAGVSPREFTVTALGDDGRVLKELKIERPPNGSFTGDLPALLAPLQGRVRVRIDAGDDHARVWSFASAGDALFLPQQ